MFFLKNDDEREYDRLDRMIDWEDALCLHEINLIYIKMGRDVEETPYVRHKHSRAERWEYIRTRIGEAALMAFCVLIVIIYAGVILFGW